MSLAGSNFARMRASMAIVAGILSATVWSATALGAESMEEQLVQPIEIRVREQALAVKSQYFGSTLHRTILRCWADSTNPQRCARGLSRNTDLGRNLLVPVEPPAKRARTGHSR